MAAIPPSDIHRWPDREMAHKHGLKPTVLEHVYEGETESHFIAVVRHRPGSACTVEVIPKTQDGHHEWDSMTTSEHVETLGAFRFARTKIEELT